MQETLSGHGDRRAGPALPEALGELLDAGLVQRVVPRGAEVPERLLRPRASPCRGSPAAGRPRRRPSRPRTRPPAPASAVCSMPAMLAITTWGLTLRIRRSWALKSRAPCGIISSPSLLGADLLHDVPRDGRRVLPPDVVVGQEEPLLAEVLGDQRAERVGEHPVVGVPHEVHALALLVGDRVGARVAS